MNQVQLASFVAENEMNNGGMIEMHNVMTFSQGCAWGDACQDLDNGNLILRLRLNNL